VDASSALAGLVGPNVGRGNGCDGSRAQDLSPLQTVELLHKAMTDADASTAAEHADRFKWNGTHVWARYVFYFMGAPNHCGYESYGLLRDRGAWKIVSFADTDNALKGHSVDELCPDESAS